LDALDDKHGGGWNFRVGGIVAGSGSFSAREFRPVIRIAITPAAFEAIAATLPFGSVGYEPQTNAKGEPLIWLESAIVDRLAAKRGPSEATVT
jgi:hypothetical protein